MSLHHEDLTRLVRTKIVVCEECGCWYWTGACNAKGYPRFELRGQAWLVHRYTYDRLVGPIPDDMTLDHRSCTSHRCVHPEHMDVVTRGENSERANVTRWHDMKFDAEGNATQRIKCATCDARDGHAPYTMRTGEPRILDPDWDPRAEADDVVGLDV